MPPELQDLTSMGDVLTVIGLALAVIAHTWVAFRWLTRQFEARDEKLRAAIYDWNRETRRMAEQLALARSQTAADTARLDKDVARIEERIENIPTLKEFGSMLDNRLAPLFELILAKREERKQ